MSNASHITRVQQNFQENRETQAQSSAALASDIAQAAGVLTECLSNQGKILVCGNGGSASDAQHFSGELLNRFSKDRPSLAAVALTTDTSTLTAIANDDHFNAVFSKQIAALGQPGDVLLALSTSGNSPNILHAITAAHAKNMRIMVLTGRSGGKIRTMLEATEHTILCVPSDQTPRIQETHILILHCLCDLIDHILFPDSKEQPL